jgi:Ca2+-binding RTX toxin-like protein
MLLPDLTPWASQSLGFVYDWTIQGNNLRLTSAIANVGTGALELRGGEIAGEIQEVYQRIFDTDGSYTDVLAGTFIHHIEHDHIHFEEFAEFRLRTVTSGGGVGDVVAAGDKVSFCLIDVERYDASGPATPQYLSCGQNQGISPGWADVYTRGLPGQSIEITDVPDGEYWLEVVADPLNHIIEADETNNVTRIKISLVRPIGSDPIPPDTFEGNDSLANASILAPPELHTYADLSIHVSQNDDYFRITAALTGLLTVDLGFADAAGDIDLEILDASGTPIGRSSTAGDREHVVIEATAGAYYYIRAFGFEGAVNPDYTMIVDPGYAELPLAAGDPFTEGADGVGLAAAGFGWHARGGADRVGGTSGRDVIYGGTGDDTLRGEGGADDLYGEGGSDTLQGGAGSDWIDGGTGADLVLYTTATSGVKVDLERHTATGGAGTDTLVAIEHVRGSDDNDVIQGNGFANHLQGHRGNDRLDGRGGNDTITGGYGRDTMTGGTGRDRFDFDTLAAMGRTAETRDVITDFQAGTDVIDLHDIDASALVAGNNAFLWRGTGAITTAAAGELSVTRYDNAGTANDYTLLSGDTDADTAAEFQIKLVGLISLTKGGILL